MTIRTLPFALACALALTLSMPATLRAQDATAPVAAERSATEGPRTRAEAAAAWSEDGLQRIDVRGLDVAYVRPGADLAVYRRIWLRPAEVSFQRDWARAQHRATGTRVRASDLQKIRDDMA